MNRFGILFFTFTITATSTYAFIPFAYWKTPQAPPPPIAGYFVLSNNSFNGNLGGLAGANSKCYDEVTTYDWMGKSGAGTITTARVKAFICTTTTCNNLQANTTYMFARANIPTVGGASFTTDVDGLGPGNSDDWRSFTHFWTLANYWSSRGEGADPWWSNAPNSGSSNNYFCTNWTSTSATRGGGYGANATGTQRWSAPSLGTKTCDLNYRLICVVDP